MELIFYLNLNIIYLIMKKVNLIRITNMTYRFIFLLCALFLLLKGTIAMEEDPLGKIVIFSKENHPFNEYLPEIDKKRLILIIPAHKKKESDDDNYGDVKPLELYAVSGQAEAEVKRISKLHKIDRIIAFGEFDILGAARLRSHLGITGQNYESALAFRDKLVMKTLLKNAGISVPDFAEVKNTCDLIEFLEEKGYPAVFKHRRGAGSKGTVILRDEEDLELLFKDESVFNHYHEANYEVETFVSGNMYHIDGIYSEGRIICSWPAIYLSQNIECAKGKHSSSRILSENDRFTSILNTFSQEVLDSLPVQQGTVFHLEVFVDQYDKIFVCEIASRVGGGVNENWIKSFGINLNNEFVRIQASLPISDQAKYFSARPRILSGEIMIANRNGIVINIPQTCPLPFVEIYKCNVAVGQKCIQSIELSDAAAYITLITGLDEMTLESNMQQALNWFYSNTEWVPENEV